PPAAAQCSGPDPTGGGRGVVRKTPPCPASSTIQATAASVATIARASTEELWHTRGGSATPGHDGATLEGGRPEQAGQVPAQGRAGAGDGHPRGRPPLGQLALDLGPGRHLQRRPAVPQHV